MNAIFYTIILLVTLSLFLGTAGCIHTDSGTTQPRLSSISVTDSDGNNLTLSSYPKRIVITGTNIAEVLVMTGATDQIVGVSDSIKENPRLASYLIHAESIGDYSLPSYEKIISLNPDLLLCYSSDKPKNLDLLKKAGIPIGFFDCYKQNKLSAEVRNLGILTGNSENANNLTDFIDSIQTLIKKRVEKIPGSDRPSVYYETGTDYSAAATNSGGDWLITTTGGINIAENTSVQWVKVTPEWIILQNPDIILKSGNDDDENSLDRTWNRVRNRSGFNSLKAVRLNQIYILSHDIVYGPESVIGLLYIAKIIHPNEFRDINPDSYLNLFASEFLPEANQSRVLYPPL